MAWPGLAQDIALSNGTAIQQVNEFKYSAEDLRVQQRTDLGSILEHEQDMEI